MYTHMQLDLYICEYVCIYMSVSYICMNMYMSIYIKSIKSLENTDT